MKFLPALLVAGIFLAALGCGGASAQQKAAPKAPAKSAPAAAAKPGDKFGEWTYQCDALPKDAPKGTQPSCFLSQSRVTTNERNEQNRVLLVNVSKMGNDRQPALFLFLPFGTAAQQDVLVTVDGSTSGLRGRVDTCLITGCRVPFLLQPDAAELLRKGKAMSVLFAPVGGNNVRVEVPLNGFTAGLAALN